MTILFIFLGILMVIGGISCMFTPFHSLLAAGYMIGILLLVYGIIGIARSFTQKAGAWEWIINILSVIVGVFALVRPGSTLVIDGMLIYLLAGFFVVQGVAQIALAFQTKLVNKYWYWSLIVGILSLILGIYCFFHPMFSAIAVGMLMGFFFVETGISMIALGIAVDDVE